MSFVDARTARAGLAEVCLAAMLALPLPSDAQPAAGAPAPRSSLPASIPVQRDPVMTLDRPAGHAWWIGLIATGVLLAIAVAVRRNRTRAIDTTGPWWSQLRGLLEAQSSPELEHLSGLRLTPGQSLHVVSWEGRRLLLGCSEQSVRLLAESTDAPRATAASAMASPLPQKAPS